MVTARQPRLIAIIEENRSFEEIIGSPAVPFLNRLAAHGTLLTHSYAVTHPSLPNYVALLSGRTPIHRDCRACTFAGPTLVDQLEARHISWAAYFQGLLQPCSIVAGAGAPLEPLAGHWIEFRSSGGSTRWSRRPVSGGQNASSAILAAGVEPRRPARLAVRRLLSRQLPAPNRPMAVEWCRLRGRARGRR